MANNYPSDDYIPTYDEGTPVPEPTAIPTGAPSPQPAPTPADNYVPTYEEAEEPKFTQKWGKAPIGESALGGATQGLFLQGAPDYSALVPAKFHNLINKADASVKAAPALIPGGKSFAERREELTPTPIAEDYTERLEQLRDYYEWLKESHPKVYNLANMAGTVFGSATLGTLMRLAKIPAASAPYVERLIYPIQSFVEGFNMKRGSLTERVEQGAQFAGTHALFSRGQEAGAEALDHLKKTGVGRKIGKGVDNLFDWISKKTKPVAEEQAFLATKPTVRGIMRLEKLPGGAPLVTKEGDVVLDPKLKDLGRTLLDNGIIDTSSPWTKISEPEKMYSKLILSKNYWGKRKAQIINNLDRQGKSPFNPRQLADEIENTIGAKIRTKQTRQDLINRYDQVLKELVDSDMGGATTYKKANDLVGEWWQDIHKASGEQKRQWRAAEEVRQFVKKRLDESFEGVSTETARVNKEYHNLAVLKDYLSNLKSRGQLGKLKTKWWKKVMGATVLGAVGAGGAMAGHPVLGATAASMLGLGAWSQKHGNQARAKLLEEIRTKGLQLEGIASVQGMLRDSLRRGETSFVATHALLYKKYPQYREAIKEINKSTDEEKKKMPYSDVGMRRREQQTQTEPEQAARY